MNEHIGEFVYAIRGRDAGKCFVVLDKQDNYLYLCDGKSRKVSNPKKKKLKHISLTNVTDNFVISKILTVGKLTNKEVRYAISNFLKRLSNE